MTKEDKHGGIPLITTRINTRTMNRGVDGLVFK